MENKKVMVKNLTNGRIGIDLPDLRLKRTWEKKDAEKPIDFNVLKEAIYDPGVEYMFVNGMLSIDDMEVKIALGLEPEDAKEPVNIIMLTDAQKRRLLTVAPMVDFKKAVEELSYEQKNQLIDFAIENELVDFDKSDYLTKNTGRDILKAVQLKRQAKEA